MAGCGIREVQENSRIGDTREEGTSAEREQNEGNVQGIITNKDQKMSNCLRTGELNIWR